MFETGKVLKVKVELSPDQVGFGRATIVENEGKSIFLRLTTNRGGQKALPRGTRVLFINLSSNHTFNGLWSTTVVGSRLIQGKNALECSRPRFEALVQKRKNRRAPLKCPVTLQGEEYAALKAVARNISRSGLGIELEQDSTDTFQVGNPLNLVVHSQAGNLPLSTVVIQRRYNWLANRTYVGVEFKDMPEDVAQNLDKLLIFLGGRPRAAGDDGEPTGLSQSLKTTRDNARLLRSRAGAPGSENACTELASVSRDDMEELQQDECLPDEPGDIDVELQEEEQMLSERE